MHSCHSSNATYSVYTVNVGKINPLFYSNACLIPLNCNSCFTILHSKYDLYSKSKVRIDVEKVKPYYLSLIDKVSLFHNHSSKVFFPNDAHFIKSHTMWFNLYATNYNNGGGFLAVFPGEATMVKSQKLDELKKKK